VTNSERFALARRIYLYIVALVSFITALFALDNLISVLDDIWLSDQGIAAVRTGAYARDAIASSGGVLLVATPIFLLHWAFIQRRQAEPEERASAWRKFFLYGASAVAVGFALVRGYELLQGITFLALGAPVAESLLWPSGWLHLILMVIVGTALQAYFHQIAVQDGDYGAETGRAGTLRRLYQMAAGLAGLVMIIFGVSSLLEMGWRALTSAFFPDYGVSWWRSQVADGLALALLGGLLAQFNWRRWRAITEQNPQEGQTALRRFYLYTALVISALTALVPAAELLRELLLLAFGGSSLAAGELWDGLAQPIAYMPVGVIAWMWYARFLHQEAAQYGESAQGITVRRLYRYAVAATGLAVLWVGAVDLAQALFEWLWNLGPDFGVGLFWQELLANGLSLLAVGAPIWAYHWRSAQAEAHRLDAAGQAERASGPRKVYLYGVALAGALLILYFLAQVVYRGLLWLLGAPDAALFLTDTTADIARTVIAALLWIVHVQAIRTDARLGADAPAQPVDTAAQRATLQARIERLETELAAARAELESLMQAPSS
jgi:hypothetical protein